MQYVCPDVLPFQQPFFTSLLILWVPNTALLLTDELNDGVWIDMFTGVKENFLSA
jgi:hypothetical protein